MVCDVCNEDKDSECFAENRSKCRSCRSIIGRDLLRTKEGVIRRIYGSQKTHSKNRGHNPPEYTYEELRDVMMKSEVYNLLYNEWVKSGYDKMMKPSIDRLNDKNGYSLDNIQIMTWKNNKAKGHNDSKTHKLQTGKSKVAVLQFSKDGDFIKEHVSIREAARSIGRKASTVSDALSGRRGSKTAGGYIFKRKVDVRSSDQVRLFKG